MAVDNLKLQLELNDAIASAAKMQARVTKELKDQLSISQAMLGVNSGADYNKVVEDVIKLQNVLAGTSRTTRDLQDESKIATDKITRGLKKSTNASQQFKDVVDDTKSSFPVLAGAALGAFDGIVGGFKNIIGLGKGVISAATGIAGALFQVGKSVFSIPFQLFGALTDMADSMGGGGEFAQAREDIRKEFGSFAEGSAKSIMQSYQAVRGELASTGLSVYRTLGTPAERLKIFAELATGMGPTFNKFSDEIEANGEVLLAYQKGLGITSEQMLNMGQRALSMGQSLEGVMNEISKSSLGMAEKFGFSQKLIAKDIASMVADVANWGSVTVEQMGAAAVYTRGLGIEIKDVMGTIEKFDNFEDAARGAAGLAQAFGMNVDAMAMMREQDPTKRLDMMRKAFLATGKDINSLSRQELKLLESQTGLTAETLKTTFSMKNQGLSMSEIQKQQDKNKKSTLTQEQAMSKLSDSIERLVKSGSLPGGGFFEKFFAGFQKGIMRSKDFRGLLRDIRKSMREVWRAGREVGQAFVDMYPGIKGMITGIRQIFDPGRIKALMSKVVGTFKMFFTDMTDNPKTALPKLLERMKKTFFDFFGASSPGGAKFLEGLKKFGMSISNILGAALRLALEKLTQGFRFVIDILTGKKKLEMPSMGGAGGVIGQMLAPMIDAIKDAVPPLWAAFKDLMTVAWEKLSTWAVQFFKEQWPKIFGILFGPALVKGGIGAAMGGFASLISGTVGKAFKLIKGKIGDGDGAGGGGEAAAELVESSAGVGGALKNFVQQTKGLSMKDMAMAAAKMTAMALLVIGGSALAMAGAVAGIGAILANFSEEELMKVGAFIVATTAMTVLVSIPLYALSKLKASSIIAGAVAMGFILPILSLGAWAAAEIINKWADFKIDNLVKGVDMMMKMYLTTAAMIPVIAVLGMAFSGPQAGAALAIAAVGMAALATLLVALTVGATAAVTAIGIAAEGIGNPEKFKMASDVVIKILDSISTFAALLGPVMKAIKPGFFERNKAEKMRENIKALESFVNSLIGDGSSGLIGMLETVLQVMTKSSATEFSDEALSFANTMMQLLAGLGEFAKAMMPSPEFFEATRGFAGLSSGDISDSINDLRGYINNMRGTLTGKGGLLEGINNFIKDIDASGISGDELAKKLPIIESVGSLLGVLGPLMTALQPPSSFFEATKSWGNTDLDEALPLYAKHMTEAIPSIQGLITSIGPLVEKFMSALGTQVKALGTSDIPTERFDAIQKLFTATMPQIMSLMQLAQDMIKGTKLSGVGGAAIEAFNATFKDAKENPFAKFEEFIKILGGKDGDDGIIQKLVGALSVVKTETINESQLATVAAAFGIIPKVLEFVKVADTSAMLQDLLSEVSVSDLGGAGEATTAFEKFFNKIGGVITAISKTIIDITKDVAAVPAATIETGIKLIQATIGIFGSVGGIIETFKMSTAKLGSGAASTSVMSNTDIEALFGKSGAAARGGGGLFGSIGRAIKGMLGGIIGVMGIIENAGGGNIKAAEKKFGIVTAAAAVAEKMIGAIKTIADIEKINVKDNSGAFDLTKVIENYFGAGISGMSDPNAKIPNMIYAIANIGNLDDIPAAEKNIKSITRAGKIAADLGAALKNYQTLGESKISTATLSADIGAVVASINETNKALSGLAPINIPKKIGIIGKGLGIKGNTLKIERGNIHIDIKVDLQMHAENLAVILQKGGWFKNDTAAQPRPVTG